MTTEWTKTRIEMKNTAGEPEVYHVSTNGTRTLVFVERTNGTHAELNATKHRDRIRRVLAKAGEI